VGLDVELDAEVPFAVKQQVRGRKTFEFMSKSSGVHDLAIARFVGRPLNHFMAAAFKSEGESSRESLALHTSDASTVLQNRDAKIDRLTGQRAKQTVEEFTALLQLPTTDKCWHYCGVGAHDLSLVHSLIIDSMSDTWRRLVFRYSCYPWKLFNVLRSDADVVACIQEFRADRAVCKQCFESSFSLPMLDWLADDGEKENALSLLKDVVDRLRPSSIAVEKHHLLVAVQRLARGAGSVPLTATIHSYMESVRMEHSKLHGSMSSNMFGTRKRSIGQLMRQGSSKKVAREEGIRASSAWNEFQKEMRSGDADGFAVSGTTIA
jgi:hypothetical protein